MLVIAELPLLERPGWEEAQPRPAPGRLVEGPGVQVVRTSIKRLVDNKAKSAHQGHRTPVDEGATQ